MPIHQALILAVIQGLTEFLPVSSSAHLALAPWLFGWADQGLSFDIALHVGTLLAVVVYFFRDWVRIAARGFGLRVGSDPELDANPRLFWLLVLGSIPVGIAGYFLHEQAETAFRTPWVIGSMLLIVGILMGIADRIGKRGKNIGQVSTVDALAIGAAQALAVVPGTSRSGITITAGLFRNLDRPAAARFSFLLSTPAIAAAAAKGFYDLHKQGGIPPEMRTPMIVGIAVSMATGCLAIAVFLRFLRRFSLRAFVAYRIAFGLVILALAFLSKV